MKKLLVIGIGILMWSCYFTLKAQDSLINKDIKYIPRNLPDLIIGKKEASRKFPSTSSRYYDFPNLRFSISIDPFFSLYLFGPYLRFDYSISNNLTLFAGLGFSSSKQSLIPDAPVYFLPINLIVASQNEDHLLLVLERERTKSKSSFAFEGGISFGTLSKVVSQSTFSLFLRYGKGSAYDETIVPIQDTVTQFTTDYKTIVTEYDANLFELCGVFRNPWGRITIQRKKSLFYMATDWGLGLGLLNVKGQQENKIVYSKTSFVVDIIFRIYAGIAF